MPLPAAVRLARWRAANARARRIQRAEAYLATAQTGNYLGDVCTFFNGHETRLSGMPDKILNGIFKEKP